MKEVKSLRHFYPNIYNYLIYLYDDLTFGDLINDIKNAGLTEDDLPIIEKSLSNYPEYINGLPNTDQNKTYSNRLRTDIGLQLLKRLSDFLA